MVLEQRLRCWEGHCASFNRIGAAPPLWLLYLLSLPVLPFASVRIMNITKEALMRHLLRRLGFYLVALWASLTVNFIIPRMAPGDPAQTLIGQMRGQASPQALQSLLELLVEGSRTIWWSHYGKV